MSSMLPDVENLLTALKRQIRYPEMFRLSRYLTDTSGRPTDTMSDVAGQSRSSWAVYTPYTIDLAIDACKSLYSQLAEMDPRSHVSVTPTRVLRLLIYADRQMSFSVQFQQAYLDATRTQEEIFFGAQQHQEMHESVDIAVREVAEYLCDI